MIREIVENWNKNKDKLEKYFSTTDQEEYDTYEKIIKMVVKYILPDLDIVYDDITSAFFGGYQGIGVFLIPTSTDPSVDEVIYTHNYYGSCSGCDTLERILSEGCHYGRGRPTKAQVKDYMSLSLDLVENMRYLRGE